MAVGDIYAAKVYFGATGQGASIGLYFQQLDPVNAVGHDAQRLCNAIAGTVIPALTGLLSVDARVGEIHAKSLSNPDLMTGKVTVTAATGQVLGEMMPEMCAVILNLQQQQNPAKRNGRVYIPYVSELSTAGNNFNAAFISGPVATLAAVLSAPIASIAQPLEKFRCVVRHRGAVGDAVGDYRYSDVTGGNATARVGIQKLRRAEARTFA